MAWSTSSRRSGARFVAVALLAGCGNHSAPAVMPGAIPHDPWAGGYASREAWISRDAAKQDLLYISGSDGVVVVTYPQGVTVGQLPNLSGTQGECADGSGDVFITSFVAETSYSKGQVYEYAHGQTTTRQILDDGTEEPMGCSVDPATGNLAVTNACADPSCKGGDVSIYARAKGTPKHYTDSNFDYYFYCGYDGAGNLFVDGFGDSYGQFRFAELPKGSSKFKNIALNVKIPQPGGIQWDGTHVAVGSQGGLIYQTTGAGGKVVGTTTLSGGGKAGRPLVRQFWIQGKTVVGGGSTVGLWHYPAGGRPVKVLTQRYRAYGVAVSLAR